MKTKFYKILFLLLFTTLIFSCNPKTEKLEINQMQDKNEQQLNVQVVNKTDPVCGMEVSENIADTLSYKGNLYGFCSSGCKDQFAENPEKFLKN